MTNIEILSGFEKEINMIDNVIEKPLVEDSLFCINQAAIKFTKTRFNGDVVHKQGYEQTEKRRNDLVRLVVSVDLQPVENAERYTDYVQYTYNYPEDHLYTLSEDVVISGSGGKNTSTSVFECTQDSFMYRITNSLTDFHYRFGKARPIRIRTSSGCKLLTDGNYAIKKYTLGYIKQPSEIKLDGTVYEYTDFDTSTMYEIIKMAALMYVENKKDQRYQTLSQEVLTQE